MIDPIVILEREQASTNSTFQGVRLSTRIMPALLASHGGDWCETFVIAKDIIALSVGDVCGHGGEKFATMVAVRQAIRDAVDHELNPAQTLAEANRFLRAYNPQEYATAIFALLNIRLRTLVFANAGHPAPLMIGLGRTSFLEFPDSDLPLGIEADLVPRLREVSVPAAASLVFYTDGVSECERKPLLGAAQLRAAAIFAHESPALHAATVIAARMRLAGSNDDDAAILTARMPSASTVETCLPRGTLYHLMDY